VLRLRGLGRNVRGNHEQDADQNREHAEKRMAGAHWCLPFPVTPAGASPQAEVVRDVKFLWVKRCGIGQKTITSPARRLAKFQGSGAFGSWGVSRE
jgi:hypothetical protein